MMEDGELRDYAYALILNHAKDVEYLSIHEMWEEYSGTDSEISEEDAQKVFELIGKATVSVVWLAQS